MHNRRSAEDIVHVEDVQRHCTCQGIAKGITEEAESREESMKMPRRGRKTTGLRYLYNLEESL